MKEHTDSNYFEVPIEIGDAYVGERLDWFAGLPVRPVTNKREKIGARIVYTLTGPQGNSRGRIVLLPWGEGWRLTSRPPTNPPESDVEEAMFRDEWHRTIVDSLIDDLRQMAGEAEGNPETTEPVAPSEKSLRVRAKEYSIRPFRLERWDRIDTFVNEDGLTQDQIARREGVSIDTIKTDYRHMRKRGYWPD